MNLKKKKKNYARTASKCLRGAASSTNFVSAERKTKTCWSSIISYTPSSSLLLFIQCQGQIRNLNNDTTTRVHTCYDGGNDNKQIIVNNITIVIRCESDALRYIFYSPRAARARAQYRHGEGDRRPRFAAFAFITVAIG